MQFIALATYSVLILTTAQQGPMEDNKVVRFCLGGNNEHCALSQDGAMIAVAGRTGLDSGEFAVWDINSGKLLLRDNLSRGPLAFSPGNRFLAVASNEGFCLIDIKSSKLYWDGARTTHWAETHLLDFTHDGKYLVSASMDDTLRVWNVEEKQLHAIFAFTSVKNGREGGLEWRNRYRDLGNGDKPPMNAKVMNIFADKIGYQIAHFSISPDGNLIALALYTNEVRVLDWKTGKVVKSLRTDMDRVLNVRFSKDGKLLAVAGHTGKWGEDGKGELDVWDYEQGTRKSRMSGTILGLGTDIAFSPDSKSIISTVKNGARVWDVVTGEQKYTYYEDKEKGNTIGVGFFPDGRTLFTVRNERGSPIHFWNAATGKKVTNPLQK